ncbi:MAG: metallophosphoesterase family protein [Deltaproteobacteria bacterium]|nr:metallophosphoesterase family protein [Deltaproteobacteria bacterium]
MKIGIFSDTHANLEALTAVLLALEHAGADELVCLGDTVGYGADPDECCDLIRASARYTILGNHDAAVAGRMDYGHYYAAARQALDLHASMVSQENLRWLAGLPYEVRDGHTAFCHGSPIDSQKFEYIFALVQAARCVPQWPRLQQVSFIGHSHLCKAFALSDDDVIEVESDSFELHGDLKYIISVGSVGQPRDYDNRAACTIYDTVARRVEFLRVEYDVATAAEKIFARGLARRFGERLFSGV